MSSRLMDTDGKLIGIGFSGNSDLGFFAIIVFSLACCCSFCFLSRAANLRSSSIRFCFSDSASRLDASNSAEDVDSLSLFCALS